MSEELTEFSLRYTVMLY